jgi:hypothetical protein
MIRVDMRTVPGMNVREHWRARARRVKAERQAVAWMLVGVPKPALPCVVTLTRTAPSNGLDDDNLAGALKAVRDQVAAWLGVDDKHSDRVRYICTQRRGPWGVEIAFAADDELMRLTDGLRPALPSDAIGDLVMLTRRRPDGWKDRVVCGICHHDSWERRGKHYHCWNCNGAGDVLEADGDDWRLVKRGEPA